MKKTNKVIDLFKNNYITQNTSQKYSELFSDFINPFVADFPDDYFIEDILDLASHAWNISNLKEIIPTEDFNNEMLPDAKLKGKEKKVFLDMVQLKQEKFKEYDRFIVDYSFEEDDSEAIFSVITSDLEGFMKILEEHVENQPNPDDFEENFINRYAIILKPKQPFFDWLKSLHAEDLIDEDEIKETNVYLVDNNIDDLDKWLRKKYDKFFTMELYDWHTNKKAWPQKRSYKMFKQWFQVDISTMIYDTERRPVTKDFDYI